ncbi:response regulator transcription factor [Streptomyces sp. HNM0574]|uniref:LuxR C-terminal-related transcriptional regulator n=1 Tax=Streptomyces sp. HNM0574 TaxID=2714954 RepID=UPI001F0FED02|nr:response regulator transcription factor [Streptomyces sp. HNM0574]
MLIGSAPGIEVVGNASSGCEAVEVALGTTPDVVLVDVQLSDTDGLEATQRITGHPALRHTRVLAYATHADEDSFFQALTRGAAGYLAAETEPQVLLTAIRSVAAGGSWIDPPHTRRLITEYVRGIRSGTRARQEPADARTALLSDREREVLDLVGQGCTNAEIAESLYLSPLTAKKYVSRLMSKLGARDRVHLALMATGHAARTPHSHETGT